MDTLIKVNENKCFTVVATNENKEKIKKNMENFGVKSEI